MIEPVPMDEEPDANKAETSSSSAMAAEAAEAKMSRKDKRKALKKEKRKQKRKEVAEKARQEEEAQLNDPEQQRLIEMEAARENERLERERREFEVRERLFLEQLAQKKLQEEEEAQRRRTREEEEAKFKQEKQSGHENEVDKDWEYIEDGPPEIIWQGNEIIVKKNKVRVKKKDADEWAAPEDPNRPTSNPLPPQSQAFAEYRNASFVSAQQLLDDVAQQTPNFGTEQDKAHCPFHLKTGACRFGMRCSRVHFYPDKSCTLLMKNMYSGPGLTWEQDEGLEHTDEEVEQCYEEFYEDVHTEFLKFGEIINFKACRNSSVHLRGNVYVHYKDLDSAVLAYHSINGRYFAGKQVTCEFVNIMRWKVAICGEYMKSKLKTCCRGATCNFIHCFRNPGGDYEWADWDKPPPRYWIKKMAALFGYSDEYIYARQVDQENSMHLKDARKISLADSEGYRSRRSQSKEMESSYRSSRSHQEGPDVHRSARRRKHSSENRKHKDFHHEKQCEEGRSHRDYHHGKGRFCDNDSDRDWSDRDSDYYRHHGIKKRRSRTPKASERDWSDQDSDDDSHHDGRRKRSKTLEVKSESEWSNRDSDNDRHHDHSRRRSRTHRVKSKRDWSAREGDDNRHHDGCRRRSRTLRVESEREWSNTDSDDDKHHDSSRRRSRTLWDHQGEEGTDPATNLPADSCNQEKDRCSEHLRKRSRYHEKISGNLYDCKDCKNEARHMRSSREWSSKDRDKEMHLSHKMRALKHHGELCISEDDHWDGRSRSYDTNYIAVRPEVTDSCYTNESSPYSSLDSEVSDDQETSKRKDSRRAYKRAKSRQHKTHNYSRGRHDSCGEDSEVDRHNEHSRPEKRVKRNSSRHDESGRDSNERDLQRYQKGGNSRHTKQL